MGILGHGSMVVGIVQQRKREREREKERAGHRLLFETDLHKKSIACFPSPRFIIFCFFDSYPPPPLPSPRCEGRAKKKEKEKKKKTRRTHSPHLILHQCGIYIKPNPPPLPGGSSLYIQQQQHHISIPPIIVIERDRLVDFI